MAKMNCSLVPMLVWLVATFLPSGGATFTWDRDSAEDCEERLEAGRCFNDPTTFYQCPVTCTKEINDAGPFKSGETETADLFWDLEVSLSGAKKMSFERFEGYVTLIAVVPLTEGMSQYFYDMLEHIHKVYPFTIEIVVFPVRRPEYPDVRLEVPAGTKITVLPELKKTDDSIETNDVLEYLEGVISPHNKYIYPVSEFSVVPWSLDFLVFSIALLSCRIV